MLQDKLSFVLIQTLTFPMRCLPYSAVHRFGKVLGTCAYYALPKFRKRCLSNLSLATDLQISSEKELICLAKRSLQNLMITCLEYAKFASENKIHDVVRCENPALAEQLMKEGKPVIFFCGHLSNWEVLFLEGTKRMNGIAIGRPVKNKLLYNWVLSIREKFGGKMIAPKNAIREGLRGLKQGAFLGIVGDQGMPDSGYSSPFFGRTAWTSPLPAILAHRTGSPLIVATTLRQEGKYLIHYSDPIWPNVDAPREAEVDRLMRESLHCLENGIKKDPGQWLWSHNRWKQQVPGKLKRRYRHETIAILLPFERACFLDVLPHLAVFRELYTHEFITIKAPKRYAHEVALKDAEILGYESEEELFARDFRFKLVFNFTSLEKIGPFYKKLAAFEVITLKDLHYSDGADLTSLLKTTLGK